MAEASDQISYEIKIREEEARNRIEQKKSEKKSADVPRVKSPSKKRPRSAEKVKVRVVGLKRSKHPPDSDKLHRAPKKAKLEFESKKQKSSPDKKVKMETADAIVKVLVPFFKKGLIASKEVFKFVAREITHVVLNRKDFIQSSDFFSKYVSTFFKSSGIILSEAEAKSKILKFDGSYSR